MALGNLGLSVESGSLFPSRSESGNYGRQRVGYSHAYLDKKKHQWHHSHFCGIYGWVPPEFFSQTGVVHPFSWCSTPKVIQPISCSILANIPKVVTLFSDFRFGELHILTLP